MKVTEITAGWSETVSLPEYANARPSIAMTAEVEEGDVAADVQERLLEFAKGVVQAEVDKILEAHSQKPKYCEDPKSLVFSPQRKVGALIDQDFSDYPDDYFYYIYRGYNVDGYTEEYCRKVIRTLESKYTITEGLDSTLSKFCLTCQEKRVATEGEMDCPDCIEDASREEAVKRSTKTPPPSEDEIPF